MLIMSRLVTPRVRKLFKSLRTRSTGNSPICARSIGQVLGCIKGTEMWNGDSQQDAAEFQRTLLESLEEEERTKLGASSREATGVHKLFRHEMKQTVSQAEDRTRENC